MFDPIIVFLGFVWIVVLWAYVQNVEDEWRYDVLKMSPRSDLLGR